MASIEFEDLAIVKEQELSQLRLQQAQLAATTITGEAGLREGLGVSH